MLNDIYTVLYYGAYDLSRNLQLCNIFVIRCLICRIISAVLWHQYMLLLFRLGSLFLAFILASHDYIPNH